MKINLYPSLQIGLMIDFGTTYEKRKHMCLDCPYSETLLGTYSKYTDRPKQNVFYDDEMVKDTINVFIRTRWATEWSDVRIEKKYQLKIVLNEPLN